MKIYAASLVILGANNEIDHHIIDFSLRQDATSTPEQTAAELAKSLLPKEGEFQHRILLKEINVQAHFAQHVNEEFQEESKEA